MYIACFAAIGIITGFAPAHGYMRNAMGFDAMLTDNVVKTEIFRSTVLSNERTLFNHLTGNEKKLSDFVSNADFYIRIETGSGKVFISSFTPCWQYDLERHSEGGFIGYENYYIHVGNAYEQQEITAISIGLSTKGYENIENYWLQVKNNMWIICVSDILLLAVGIILMCIICRVTGECPDGTVKLHPFFMVPYEIPLGLLCLAVIMPSLISGNAFANSGNWSKPLRMLCMICFGGVFAVITLVLLYFIVCMNVRSKNKRFARGSIIVCLIMGLWYILKWGGRHIARFFRCLKEMLTGELFKGSTSKKLLMMDLVFIIITALNIILFFAVYAIAAIWVILEVFAFVLFLYGRYAIQRDLAVLERQIREMYNGNYAYSEPLHKNSPYAESSEKLYKLASQYRKGIEESVRAERMKIDLVTNVSHDLKTPLTSIISYVELLSREELSPAARDYVTILQQKSTRLKNIVADVFELAKTTSGEIAVANEQLDLNKLSYQTLAEMEDKISRSGFIVKANICDPPVTVVSDGKRIYRIIQNLMDNALKYSLSGTRIYYSLEKTDGGEEPPRAVITIKNIASYEMNFTTEEILERFTRGDKSRTTEGSGLGLSIAQGFALACGGDFKIEIDGDMFKAMISFPLYNESLKAPEHDGGTDFPAAREEIVLPLSPAPEDMEDELSLIPS
ncbi:MAG: HAMP domain-containing histidine kinase, partial [Oscillospiraceae bacterium]|nr:HAMP domain-containing histidine kinase [Oscillospiraceae bacterium]